MKVSVALSCFYYWGKEFDIPAQLNCLELIQGLALDGVELHVSEDDLLTDKFELFESRVDDYFVTVHLDYFHESVEIYDKIRKLKELLDVQYFVIHADKCAHLKAIPDDIPFLIENSDEDKEGFQDLGDVKKLGKPICLDINHLQQTHPDNVKEQFDIVKDNIKELHISCLKNPEDEEFDYISTQHHLIWGSGYKIPDFLPKDVVWVIEGVVPTLRLDMLKNEIALIRKL